MVQNLKQFSQGYVRITPKIQVEFFASKFEMNPTLNFLETPTELLAIPFMILQNPFHNSNAPFLGVSKSFASIQRNPFLQNIASYYSGTIYLRPQEKSLSEFWRMIFRILEPFWKFPLRILEELLPKLWKNPFQNLDRILGELSTKF